MTMMKRICSLLPLTAVVSMLLLSSLVTANDKTQSLYLKEILEGRCYFCPPIPEEESSSCPALVGSFMNILENHLDADIEPSLFHEYLQQQVSFGSPPRNKALFVLKLFGSTKSTFTTPGLVTPEDTPGGALFRDLVFCGVDQRDNCSVEKSKAYWSFWSAVYSKFASQVQGHVRIVMEPLADAQFLQRSAISKFMDNKVTSATIYFQNNVTNKSNNCESSKGVNLLKSALHEVGVVNVTCMNDAGLVALYTESVKIAAAADIGNSSATKPDNNSTTMHKDENKKEPTTTGEKNQAQEYQESPEKKKRGVGGFRKFFLVMVGGCLAYVMYNGYYKKIEYQHIDSSRNNVGSENSRLVVDGQHHDFFLQPNSPPEPVILQ